MTAITTLKGERMIPGMTHVHVRGYGVWHLIENFDHFEKRFTKAWRRRQFLDMRYGGTNFALNPSAVMYFEGCR